jgi:hypothetical protein
MKTLKKIIPLHFSLILLLLPACLHQTIENVFTRAESDYRALLLRYDGLLHAFDQEDVIEKARLIGIDNHLSFWNCLSQSLWGNQHLITSTGTPLHRALYFMECDSELLARHINAFEQRGLMHYPVYHQIINLRRSLLEYMRIIQAHKTFISESHFIEQQRVHKQQLYEQERQTYLLQKIADKESTPVYYYSEKRPAVVNKEKFTIYL